MHDLGHRDTKTKIRIDVDILGKSRRSVYCTVLYYCTIYIANVRFPVIILCSMALSGSV